MTEGEPLLAVMAACCALMACIGIVDVTRSRIRRHRERKAARLAAHDAAVAAFLGRQPARREGRS